MKLKNITSIEEKVSVEINKLDNKYIEQIDTLDNVHEVSYDNNVLVVSYKEDKQNNEGKSNIVDMMEYLKKEKIKYNKIFSERPTLNDVFLELTGKELRD